MRRSRVMLFLAGPVLAFGLARLSAPAHPPSLPPTPCPPAIPPALAELEARWEQTQREAADRLQAFEAVLYGSIETCGLQIDVDQVDCSEEPCLVVFAGALDQPSLDACRPWADLYGGQSARLLTVGVTCGDGAPDTVQVLAEPRGLEPAEGDPWWLPSAVLAQRTKELARQWRCAGE